MVEAAITDTGEDAEAQDLCVEALEMVRRHLGAAHPATAAVLTTLGVFRTLAKLPPLAAPHCLLAHALLCAAYHSTC